jgi:hypothetical protein
LPLSESSGLLPASLCLSVLAGPRAFAHFGNGCETRWREPVDRRGFSNLQGFRYYVSGRLITGGGGKAPDQPHGQRIPAPNLEALVTDRLRSLCANPVEISNALSGDERDAPMQKRLRDAVAALSARWESMPTERLNELMRSALARTQVYSDRVDLEVDPAALVRLLLNESGGEETGLAVGRRLRPPIAPRHIRSCSSFRRD